MLTFGVLEVFVLWWGLTYIYLRSNNNNNTEYIELNDTQFTNLQSTLQERNILPERMNIIQMQNNFESVPPPLYVENNQRETNVDSEQSTNASNVNNHISDTDLDNDAKPIE
tara:strand:- start:239 stop:574 length:336 start_codon:yes stop_codon:yes gene_type:complete